ncbi:MAG: NAD(P)H-hydrate dehydratase [bacterium]|nr:NAD(P)H-hydrate dehydratase [bacterium]
MEFVVDGKTMKKLDDYTINKIGIPSLVLMERAALAFTNVLLEKIESTDSIIVLTGPGNNGADGVAIARLLKLKGYQVEVYIMGETKQFSIQLKEQISIAAKLGVNFINNAKICEYTVVIDAIFGIGLGRSVGGNVAEVIECVNNCDNQVFSVDIPSGIHSGCGKVMEHAIRADYTVTFGYQKVGMLMYPGCEYAGRVSVADIGFPTIEFAKLIPTGFIYQKEDLKLLPSRPSNSNKGSFGKVLVIAGSKNMSGACYMSAKAAYRMGAGLVKVLTVEENRTIMQTMLPEAIISTYHSERIENELSKIQEDIRWASTIVLGPGIGISASSRTLLSLILKEAQVPTIIDADGLNLLAELGKLEEAPLNEHMILTPHIKEMSRLLHIELNEVRENAIEIAQKISKEKNYTLVLKDARTLVAGNESLYINTSGNDGMATGGSGDVLTGVIAGLLAQGMRPYQAACLGTYIHGMAGDIAAQKLGKYSLMATDIIEYLSVASLV